MFFLSRRARLHSFIVFAQLGCSTSEIEWSDIVPSGGAEAGGSASVGGGGKSANVDPNGAAGSAPATAASGGKAVAGGAAGSGDGPLDPYGKCDPSLNDDPVCAGERCDSSTSACAPWCRGGELPMRTDCPEALSGTAERLCSSRGACTLRCNDPHSTCPDGMVCFSESVCAWP